MTYGSNFTFEVLKVLREEGEGQQMTALQVVKWERAGAPALEKRRIYVTRDGQRRFRKLVGLSASDVAYVVQHALEIQALMEE